MDKIRFGILAMIFLLFGNADADDITLQVLTKNTVSVGERFTLKFVINAKADKFTGPDIENFYILSGPNQSSSSSVQIINGRVTQSVEYTYTYLLQANNQGKFRIPEAKAIVGGKIYRSEPVTITVQPASKRQNKSRSQSAHPGIDSDDIFLRSTISKSDPYRGEQVVITYKLYFRISVSNYGIQKTPAYPGIWSADLNANRKELLQYTEIVNGTRYNVAELKKDALFPLKDGEITISPMEISITARVRKARDRRQRDPFGNFFDDPFFGGGYQNVELTLKSKPEVLNVKPLPYDNRPATFKGAVGSFDFVSSIDKTELKANEPITLKYTIKGKGNVELAELPDIQFPPDFEVYDPKVSKNINYASSGITGTKTFEYLLIPRNPGNFALDALKFSYFDPVKKEYFIKETPEYNIKVLKGEGDQSAVTYSGSLQEDIKYIGQDIRYIKTLPFQLHQKGYFFFGSNWFFILLIAPVILFALMVILWKKEVKRRSNVALMRNKRATKIARKNLQKAQVFMKENKADAFYEEISQALWGYLSDKFSIPLSELSMDTVNDKLERQKVSQDIIQEFTGVLEHTEYARFAPGNKSHSMEDIYHEALNIIRKIESQLK